MSVATPSLPRAARKSRQRSAPQQAQTASKLRLRTWIRLLRSTRAIEAELRERLRVRFAITLPQFDVLAAVARAEDGITMTELSRFLMVSNGNSTGIIDRLVAEGLVSRAAMPGDRRSIRVQLTPKGARDFAVMAAEHETWVDEILTGFSKSEAEAMIHMLDGLLHRTRNRGDKGP
jgi:DNA-binding MarR family transcriptional regulator